MEFREKPVTMAVRWLASMHSVTCSAVEEKPDPNGPFRQSQLKLPGGGKATVAAAVAGGRGAADGDGGRRWEQ